MSRATVVAASRGWICVRLATYENKEEAEFLTSIFTGRSGLLENTVFTFLAPDGKTRLTRAGRGPHHVLAGRRGPPRPGEGSEEAAAVTKVMERLLANYSSLKEVTALPQALDFRRALNVAACDNQPLVVLHAETKAKRDAMRAIVTKLGWSETFVGRLQYIVVADRADLAVVKKLPATEGIYVVQPNRFGLEGEVIGSTGAKAKSADVSAMLLQSLATFETFRKSTRVQRRDARGAGAQWKSEVPVTDPGIPPGGRRKGPR